MRTPLRATWIVAMLALTGCSSMRGMQEPMPSARGQTAQREVTVEHVRQAFTDENVAAVLTMANLMEIEPSKLAMERSQDRNVRAFARKMVNEHGALQQQMQDMLARKGMRAVHNSMSMAMARNLQPTLTQLQRAQARDFDKQYVLQQLASHQMALHTLDNTLIPATRDADMRSFLQNRVRPAISEHLDTIQQIHDRMMSPQA